MIYIVNIAFSGAFLLAVFLIGRSRFGTGGICLISAVTLFLGVFFQFMLPWMVFPQAFLTLVLALICLCVKAKPKTVFGLSLAGTVLYFVFAVSSSVREINRLVELREEYPLESMVERLAYETRERAASSPHKGEVQATPLSSEVESNLVAFEQRESTIYRHRHSMLERLHDRTRDKFVKARGFGAIRMTYVGKEAIVLPEAVPVPLPANVEEEQEYQPDTGSAPSPMADANNEKLKSPAPARPDLASLHKSGLEEFLDPGRIGYVKDRKHVAGFLSHGFQKMPRIESQGTPQTLWRVTRLQLVSLLKHDKPVVYVSPNLPKMDELQSTPTRPMDEFEERALGELNHSKDMVVEDADKRIRMLGSIRAGNDCLKCHQVQRGDLLGAFSYELLPQGTRPTKKRREKHGPPVANHQQGDAFKRLSELHRRPFGSDQITASLAVSVAR